MKRLRLLCFIVLIPSLSYIACKKKDPTQPPVYLTYGLKNYFDYKPGSYWIYKDSLSISTLDSFIVYDYTDDTASIGGVSTETVTINMHAFTTSAGVIDDSAEWDITLQNNISSLGYYGLPVGSSGSYIYYTPFTQGWPFGLGTAAFSAPNCSSPTNYSIDFLPYYTVDSNVVDSNTHTYSNVYQMHYQRSASSCSPSIINDWIYTSQFQGIVKLNLRNQLLQKVLELERYHIIK